MWSITAVNVALGVFLFGAANGTAAGDNASDNILIRFIIGFLIFLLFAAVAVGFFSVALSISKREKQTNKRQRAQNAAARKTILQMYTATREEANKLYISLNEEAKIASLTDAFGDEYVTKGLMNLTKIFEALPKQADEDVPQSVTDFIILYKAFIKEMKTFDEGKSKDINPEDLPTVDSISHTNTIEVTGRSLGPNVYVEGDNNTVIIN